MEVYCSPKETVEEIWKEVSIYFQRALDKHNAEYTLDDLKNLIINGGWKLFVFVNDENIIKGGAVVSFITYPKSHKAFVTCIGGNQLVHREYYLKFVQLMRDYGATRVQGYVTDSIERLGRRFGIIKTTSVVEIIL
jgi:hypothetical protein